MNSKIKIGKISTKPEQDPYSGIAGVVSKTVLKLDPRDRIVWVEQEYNDNSTLVAEWNGLVLTWRVPNHPLETDMQEWIEENFSYFENICNGHEVVWNGHTHVGNLTDNAKAVYDAIASELENDGEPFNFYKWWTVDDWLESSLQEIHADMADDQLKEFADSLQPASNELVIGDILGYLTQHRDNLKADEE